jgi:hypothetical protein
VVRHGQHAGAGVRRFGAAKACKDIEGNRRKAANGEYLSVSDRHAIAQAQVTINRRNLGATFWHGADHCETNARAIVHDTHVARIAICKRIEVASACQHRAPREFDDLTPFTWR